MRSCLRRARLRGALVVGVLAVTLGSCGWPAAPNPSSPGAGGRYAEQVFTDIEQIATGVTYKPANPGTDNPTDLKLDAWAPAGDTATERPAIVWGFPGAWIGGSRAAMTRYAQDSARRGYVGIVIDYRLRGQGWGNWWQGIVPAYLDTIAAGEWLRANAERYRIDPDAIVAGGSSAGGMNAINAVTLPGAPWPYEVPAGTVNPERSPFAAAISNSGASAGRMVQPYKSISRRGQAPVIMFGGMLDFVASYGNWQVPTCEDHLAQGNVCEFVTYWFGSHTLPAELDDLLYRAAVFVKQRVLIPQGYPPTD
jgi:alpha/beta hydrolase fold